DQIERVMSSKWLDPECGEDGCQSLKWKHLYEQAVQGRRDFRQAYRDARAQVSEREVVLEVPREGSDAIFEAIRKARDSGCSIRNLWDDIVHAALKGSSHE